MKGTTVTCLAASFLVAHGCGQNEKNAERERPYQPTGGQASAEGGAAAGAPVGGEADLGGAAGREGGAGGQREGGAGGQSEVSDAGASGEAGQGGASPGSVGAAGAAGASTGLDGATVTLLVKNPIGRAISALMTSTVSDDVEFLAIEDQRLSGFIVGAADIDVAADSIVIDYHPASALTFGNSNFNGYVLDFSGDGIPPILGLAIDPASTADVVDAKLSFDENTARINVAGLTVNTESKLIVSLLFAPVADPATPFSGSWVGTVQQGTSQTFDYRMDLVQRGTSVSGTTRISTASSYGVLSVSGSVTGSSLTFTEGAVYEQQITSGSRWCLKQGTLTLSSANTRVLAGPWTASGCQAGTIQVEQP